MADIKTKPLDQAHADLTATMVAHYDALDALSSARQQATRRDNPGDLGPAPDSPEWLAAAQTVTDAEVAYDVAYQVAQRAEAEAAMSELATVGRLVTGSLVTRFGAATLDDVHRAGVRLCANARWWSHRMHDAAGNALEAKRYAALRAAHGEAEVIAGAKAVPPHPQQDVPHVWCAKCATLGDHVAKCGYPSKVS